MDPFTLLAGGSALASLFGLGGAGKQTTQQNSSGTSSSTGSTTSNGTSSGTMSGTTSGTSSGTNMPVIDPEWLKQYMAAAGGMGAGGMTPDQDLVSRFLRGNIGPDGGGTIAPNFQRANQAVGEGLQGINAGAATTGGVLDYLKNQQNNGSFTLGKYFGNAPTIGAAQAADPKAVIAGRGADYAGSYATPLDDAYVNSSLNDFDTGVDRGFNALRANNASAFGNKRTGVAEGQFMADAARQRGNLASGLRLNAFNTATGYGMSDADRAFAASGKNADLGLSNAQFNANLLQNANMFNSNLTDSRQKFDIGQAETGEQRRLGVAGQIAGLGGQQANMGSMGASVGSQGLNNALNVNSANMGSAGAIGTNAGMSMDQLFKLLGIGTSLNGTRTDGTTSGTTSANTSGTTTNNTTAQQNNSFNSTGTGTTPGDPFGQFGNLLMAGAYAGNKAGWFG